jgi:hypothetical protein
MLLSRAFVVSFVIQKSANLQFCLMVGFSIKALIDYECQKVSSADSNKSAETASGKAHFEERAPSYETNPRPIWARAQQLYRVIWQEIIPTK